MTSIIVLDTGGKSTFSRLAISSSMALTLMIEPPQSMVIHTKIYLSPRAIRRLTSQANRGIMNTCVACMRRLI
jgi:hypothetical protein